MAQEKMQYLGVNRIALVARDMAATVDFYQNVLEMPLVKTVDLPNGRGQQFFFDCGSGRTITFLWWPDAPAAAPGIASMHPDFLKGYGTQTAHGSMNHLALHVPLDRFDATAERLRNKGIPIRVVNHEDTPQHASPEINEHTWVRSIYFRDTINDIHLELSAYIRPFSKEDVQHDPVNEKGEKVPLKDKKATSLAAE